MADRFTLQSDGGIIELQNSTDDLLLQSNGGAAAASPVIPFRIGMLATALLVATAYPVFADYEYQANPANPVIPYRVTSFIDTTPTTVPIASQYGRVMPFAQSVASANPVIGYRYGQGVSLVPDPVIPSQIRAVLPAPRPYAVPPLRIGAPLASDAPTTPPSQYIAFPFVSVSVATANPVIPYRLGQPLASEAPANVPSQYLAFPFVSVSVDTANPVIPPRITTLLPETPPDLIRTAFFPFPYLAPTVAAANPVIPTRMGQWPSDTVAPLVGIQGYQRFPYPGVPEAPSSPVIPIRTRLLSELTDAVRIDQPLYYGFIFRNGAPTPNLGRLLYDVDTGHVYMTLTPTGRLIVRIT